jgi:hypothetical protein
MGSKEISHFFEARTSNSSKTQLSIRAKSNSADDPIDITDSPPSKTIKVATELIFNNSETTKTKKQTGDDSISAVCPQSPVQEQNTAYDDCELDDDDNNSNENEDQALNPFAKFAFQQISDTAAKSTKWVAPKRKFGSDNQKRHNNDFSDKKKRDFVPMMDLSPSEQESIRQKWHSLSDATDPLEDRRFQVMVASRLHARCQEPVVRRCMTALREAMGGQLTVSGLSQADPEVLASVLSSLQYYNVKSQHIVKAAQEIECHFGGTVPESNYDLQKITGIGPVMGDLLACINTRASYDALAES